MSQVRYKFALKHSSIFTDLKGPIDATNKHIDDYALVGLRTLAIAVKELTSEDLDWFDSELDAAQQAIEVWCENILTSIHSPRSDCLYINKTKYLRLCLSD